MEPYLFHGVVIPERAQLSLSFRVKFGHLASGVNAEAQISVLVNQLAVWIEGDYNWDIFDLRNVVKNLVGTDLAMIGYLKGYAYDVEITRVLCRERGIDHVFGIDVPCVTSRNPDIDLNEALLRLREKTTGESGIFLRRCFDDLVSAMKHPDDTGFYCYRAIESLRHHCASKNQIGDANKARQWQTLREVAGIEEQSIRFLKSAADPLRHGELGASTSADREELFNTTWRIVDAYLSKL